MTVACIPARKFVEYPTRDGGKVLVSEPAPEEDDCRIETRDNATAFALKLAYR